MEMIQRFPPMGIPFAVRGLDNPYVADCCVGAHVIHAAFAGNVGAEACGTMFGLAQKHSVGFHDVSGDDGSVPP